MKYRVSIVIPNWNGVYLMEKHLRHVIRAVPEAEVIIADDMSSDGSVEYIRKNFPDIIIAEGTKREGFAANVNRGVSKAKGDVVMLLNTDVEPEQGFLKPILRHFDDREVFAVGCLEKSHEKDGIVRRGRGVARWEKGYFIHARGDVEHADTAWVSGGSGAFRKSLWDTLGGMDTLYNPFYWEDIDLSYRARKAGYRTVFEPKSIVHHYHEEGKIKKSFTPSEVKKIAYRNQYIFIWKNVSDLSIFIQHIFWTPLRLMQALISGDFLMIGGFCSALTRIPEILRHRSVQSGYWRKGDKDLCEKLS